MPSIARLLVVCAVAFAPFAGARAEPLAGAQIYARAAGGEFRGDTRTLRGFESHIWRLNPDGQARSVAVVKRAISAFGSAPVEFSDVGMWRIEGNFLCVQWQGENVRFNGCYAVDLQQGDHVRLIGPSNWEGTLSR